MLGTMRRLGRLFHPQSARAVVLALDHGASEGMVPGLAEVPALLAGLREVPVQGVVLNKGMARATVGGIDLGKNVVVNLSAGTKHGLPTYNQSLVCSVNEALRLGADAVSVHLNIGNDLEDRMLQDFGMVTDDAHALGIPVMATIFARGGQIVNELDPALIAHCIRLGGELGADVVCVPYSGDRESFSLAVAACPVPVLAAGGPSQPGWQAFKNMAAEVLEAGAAGVCLGRNIFQHKEPLKALSEVCELVHVPREDGDKPKKNGR
ncbi:class I fructose-bisphosphate aldolase [Desulfocurvus sp. DL9XJH121]